MSALAARNRKLALACAAVVAGMGGLAFASAPLYDLFCRVTGFGGTTQAATSAPAERSARTITVRFDANVAAGLGWRFQPEQRQVVVALGETRTASYRATNAAAAASVGTATFNVTPFKAGPYFNKLACFCFVEQALGAGESVAMPVEFFVDPALANDPNLADVDVITLSYTFFPAKTERPTALSSLVERR